MNTEPKIYQCPECGLHYEDKSTAKRCEAFCKKHNGCSLEITSLSVERTKLAHTLQPPKS